MENVVLTIHLLLALALIGAVLLQRSEGGGLGMGGGGGGAISGRSAGTALGKLTWILAIAFICTSMTLTIIAAKNAAGSSVLDRITDAPAPAEAPAVDLGDDNLLPPSADENAPLTPTAD
ncbi:preprotein translocase subunit SecG [Roseovarius aestuarii]|uniref:Protein-export membrane protein SecG n=1 Tax=Roseovarius aestuarii TaxID=475083 RepID=A0A1X7BV46_9RHOB|nr:preprotein translocase subunit SecG [Roseovarius aestuarii]SMC13360.1 preprotein translocase subunit SecG [Roseovarius aestuarii]